MHLIIVHRLLQSLLLPPFNSILLMILSFIIPIKNKTIKRTIFIVGFILLYLQSTPIFAYKLAQSIEPKPFKSIENINPDAIIVLSGGINNNGYEYPIKAIVNTDTLTRLRYAIYIAKKHPKATLILSGGFTGARYREADVMKDTIKTMFNIDNPLIVENNSRNTNENAKFTAEIIRKNKFKTCLLVTQAYHIKRAEMLFNKNGIYPVAAPTDYTHNDDVNNKILMMIPNSRAQNMTARSLHEIFGYYLYKINYVFEGGTKQFLDYL